MSLILNKVVIEVRASDGFINATQLCKAGGKRFPDWYRMDSTKELIGELEKSLDEKSDLIDSSKSKYKGSWIHPDLAIPLAMWVSSKFVIKVSAWVGEWRAYSPDNEHKFQQALQEIEPSDKVMREKEIQKELQVKYNGLVEVETPVGYIDLLTDNIIMEIKTYTNWKHAIGQVLSYSTFYSDRNKYIYLFDRPDGSDDTFIKEVCDKYQITVLFE